MEPSTLSVKTRSTFDRASPQQRNVFGIITCDWWYVITTKAQKPPRPVIIIPQTNCLIKPAYRDRKHEFRSSIYWNRSSVNWIQSIRTLRVSGLTYTYYTPALYWSSRSQTDRVIQSFGIVCIAREMGILLIIQLPCYTTQPIVLSSLSCVALNDSATFMWMIANCMVGRRKDGGGGRESNRKKC